VFVGVVVAARVDVPDVGVGDDCFAGHCRQFASVDGEPVDFIDE
jgi:hypothetical protein